MSDDIRHRGEPDRSRISLSQEHELQYWIRVLGVSEWELRNAIQRAGNAPEEVRKFLRRH